MIVIAIVVTCVLALSLVACDKPWEKWFNKDKDTANHEIADANAFDSAINQIDTSSVTIQGRISGDEIEGGSFNIERLGNHSAHAHITTSGSTVNEVYEEFVAEGSWREYTKTGNAWGYESKSSSAVDSLIDIFALGIFGDISNFSNYTYDANDKSYKASVNYNNGYSASHYEITLKFTDGCLVYLHYIETYGTDKHSESEFTFSKHNATSFTFPTVG